MNRNENSDLNTSVIPVEGISECNCHRTLRRIPTEVRGITKFTRTMRSHNLWTKVKRGG